LIHACWTFFILAITPLLLDTLSRCSGDPVSPGPLSTHPQWIVVLLLRFGEGLEVGKLADVHRALGAGFVQRSLPFLKQGLILVQCELLAGAGRQTGRDTTATQQPQLHVSRTSGESVTPAVVCWGITLVILRHPVT